MVDTPLRHYGHYSFLHANQAPLNSWRSKFGCHTSHSSTYRLLPIRRSSGGKRWGDGGCVNIELYQKFMLACSCPECIAPAPGFSSRKPKTSGPLELLGLSFFSSFFIDLALSIIQSLSSLLVTFHTRQLSRFVAFFSFFISS